MRRQNRKELLDSIQERIGYMHSDVAAEKMPLRFLLHLSESLDEDRYISINEKLKILIRLAYKMPIEKIEVSDAIHDD